MENSSIATTILLDFSKAFDRLDHRLIIEKLKVIDITEKEAQWFDSHLSNGGTLRYVVYMMIY